MENMSHITKILTSSTCDDSVKLQSIQSLKNHFRPPEKVLGNINLKFLLQEGVTLLKNKTHKKDFLISYGTRLINYFGKDITFHPELIMQLEYILIKLQEQDESVADKLYVKVCQLQSVPFLHFTQILKIFKHNFERSLLGWIENNESSDIEFLVGKSATSPELFQTLTSILYLILVKTLGHWRVFEVTSSFVRLVISICTKTGVDFLCLYPPNCRRIVSLLMVPPECYSDEIIKNEVLGLLMKGFSLDRKKILILLSHYPDWLCVFRNHLVKRNSNS